MILNALVARPVGPKEVTVRILLLRHRVISNGTNSRANQPGGTTRLRSGESVPAEARRTGEKVHV